MRLAPFALLLAALPSLCLAFSPLAVTSSLRLRGSNDAARTHRLSRVAIGPKMMADGDGPIYEDDLDAGAPAKQPKRGGISDSMRAKLMKESQAMGGDPDAPSINFAVVIGGIIATLLVCLSLIGAI
eukprot:CAMPEP_0181326004 /NCGR_PEP_ID=MMETSP1101-20121128/21247_1 /TAXON_ID=46948 /ORGANISM="Rhodomonas abbreviata, Strain Caron Lab Isolate" /LENGTH=126 /DNA_ID=CAMNT_0023434389 /DNA_START=14 /DNA_END=394 /DNA_ORIENTATION=-